MSEDTIAMREPTVGKLVAQDYRKASIFKKFGIDFCCGGGISVTDACKSFNADEAEVRKALEDLDNALSSTDKDFNSWPIDKLLNFIVEEHHAYVREAIPMVAQFVNKVKNVHGENKPNVSEISDVFMQLSGELLSHLEKEEQILFPYAKHLLAVESGLEFKSPHFGDVSNPVRVMMAEHDDAGEALWKIEALTEGYNPPKGACATHQVSYAYLKEFMDDLMQHIHLENNILFPKIIALEQKIRESN